MLIDELVENKRNFVVIGNSMFFKDDSGQTRQPRITNWINKLMNLLALKQRPECFSMMILCVLK